MAVTQGNRLREANGAIFSYNDRDHVSDRRGLGSTIHYEYNVLDMLIRCDLRGESWAAEYDPLGRRVRKSWRGHTTDYYWDDFRLVAEVRDQRSLRLYLYVDEKALAPFMFVEYDGLDAEPGSGRRYYLFTNQIGVPIYVEDDAGRTVWFAGLDLFGRVGIDRESSIDVP